MWARTQLQMRHANLLRHVSIRFIGLLARKPGPLGPGGSAVPFLHIVG